MIVRDTLVSLGDWRHRGWLAPRSSSACGGARCACRRRLLGGRCDGGGRIDGGADLDGCRQRDGGGDRRGVDGHGDGDGDGDDADADGRGAGGRGAGRADGRRLAGPRAVEPAAWFDDVRSPAGTPERVREQRRCVEAVPGTRAGERRLRSMGSGRGIRRRLRHVGVRPLQRRAGGAGGRRRAVRQRGGRDLVSSIADRGDEHERSGAGRGDRIGRTVRHLDGTRATRSAWWRRGTGTSIASV